jgi:hypothetical protein
MENQLIQIYLFVCHSYLTSSQTCFQRMSNNSNPRFTDQEIITIYFFAHINGRFQNKQIYQFIKLYWADWFPLLPSYQTFVLRLNQLEPSFQTIGGFLLQDIAATSHIEVDHIVDSMPVMLARHGNSYSAKVALDKANVGYCPAKKTRFHGVKLHVIAQRECESLPRPEQIWMCEASHHDSTAFIGQRPDLYPTTLFGDLAYPTPEIKSYLKEQGTQLLTPKKKPKGEDLAESEKYYNKVVRKFRQPIESLFNWIEEKTGIERASKVRSTDGLMIHCWGKLAVAMFLLVFNY